MDFGAESVTGKTENKTSECSCHSGVGLTQYWSVCGAKDKQKNKWGLGNWYLRCFTGKPRLAHPKPAPQEAPGVEGRVGMGGRSLN